MNHTEQARSALLQNLATALAHDAADVLEPSAGQPIDQAARGRIAAAMYQAFRDNVPPLVNVLHALDMIPATA